MSRSNAKRRQTRPSGERWPPPGRLSLRVCKHAVVSVASELGRARDQARQRRQNGGCYKSQARDVVSGRLYSPGFASPLDLGRLRGASSNASPPWRPQRQSHPRPRGPSSMPHPSEFYRCMSENFSKGQNDLLRMTVDLLFGFSLARANARMLINADSKRRSARNSVRACGPPDISGFQQGKGQCQAYLYHLNLFGLFELF
eukprot:COSAG03_NODE_434_length_7933_cov_12.379755_4_plen_201_part_00